MELIKPLQLVSTHLAQVFRNTTATYKFYWLLSILQLHAQSPEERRLDLNRLAIQMIGLAWYPIHYFRLSFGKMDSLQQLVVELQQEWDIPIDSSCSEVTDRLMSHADDLSVRNAVKKLLQHVPYRFLSPWIPFHSNVQVVRDSQAGVNDCLYALQVQKGYLELSASWSAFLLDNTVVLTDYVLWNLTLFLQQRNPNVPAIAQKLMKPEKRASLVKQHQFWDWVLENGPTLHCIYTHEELHPKGYELDHFIPWSFVSHDLNWNLLPVDARVNSSKRDRLPDLDFFLPRLAGLQQQALRLAVSAGKQAAIFEDYYSLGSSPQDLAHLHAEDFLAVFERTFRPMHQLASNMGFLPWEQTFCLREQVL